MIKRKMAPNSDANNNSNNVGCTMNSKTKRQKLSNSSGCKKQQTTIVRKQASSQQVNPNQNQRQEEEPVWIYGLINNIEQMLSQFNAANNNQRLQQAVQQQQQLVCTSHSKPTSQVTKSGRTGAKSRPSNSSSGYSTPSSLYSSASLSPPFSNSSSVANCAYSSPSSSNSPISASGIHCQSPKQQHNQTVQQTATSTTTTTTTKTQANSNKTGQQQQLPRSPLSRQIKFHEYKGPPQTRRPSNQQKHQQQQTANVSTSAGQDNRNVKVEQPIDNVVLQRANPSQQIRTNSMSLVCQQQHQQQQQPPSSLGAGVPLNSQAAVLAPMGTVHQQAPHCRQLPAVVNQEQTGLQSNNGRLMIGPVETIDRQVMIVRQPHQAQMMAQPSPLDNQINGQQNINFAANSNHQRQSHVSLQLIRRPNGQQQQVLVVDAVAFQQMQQQQQQQMNSNFDQKQNNIIVLQHEPMIAQQSNNEYNTLSNNNQSDDNNFQMHQPLDQSSSFMIDASNTNTNDEGAYLSQDNSANLNLASDEELYYRSHQQSTSRIIAGRPQAKQQLQQPQQQLTQPFGGCQQGPISEGTSMSTSMLTTDCIDQGVYQQYGQQPQQQTQHQHHYQNGAQINNINNNNNQMQYYQPQEMFDVNSTLDDGGDADGLADDTCEIEPTISFEGDLDHGMMYSEFIDSQDIPLNVDESDWLKKFLPPCSSS